MAYVNFDKLDMDKLTRETVQELMASGDNRPCDQVYDILQAFERVVKRLDSHGVDGLGKQAGGDPASRSRLAGA